MTLKHPGLWRFIILEICVARVSSQRPWSNSSLSRAAGAEPAAPPARRPPQDYQRRASLRRRRPDVPLVYRGLRLCVAPLRRTGLGTSCPSPSGGICRDHHDVGHVGMQYLTARHQLAAAGSLKNTHPGSAILAATTAASLPRPCCTN